MKGGVSYQDTWKQYDYEEITIGSNMKYNEASVLSNYRSD